MWKKIVENAEILILAALFLVLACLSFYHVGQSVTVSKYHFQWGIKNLTENYSLYHSSLKSFLVKTAAFHPGSSESEWRTAFYLLPLYMFCDLWGGLSLIKIYFFTILVSLAMVVLFYYWVRTFWGRQAAFWGTLFFGFSSVFQEIARSGSYDAYSMFMGMIWVMLFFSCAKRANPVSYGILGAFTGFTWYGYALLRTLIFSVFAEMAFSAKYKRLTFILFMAGFLLWVLPGVIILFEQLKHYHGSLHDLFIDKENLYNESHGSIKTTLMILTANAKVFIERMAGAQQLMEPVLKNRFHAHFLHPLLVVPMLLGARQVIKSFKEQPNRILLLLSFVIFLTPLFTSEKGYLEARRSLLYVVPAYCFIGLGLSEIFNWARGIKSNAVKWLMVLLLSGGVIFVMVSEIKFVSHRMLKDQRDLGLLEFADKVKHIHIHSKMYYVEVNGRNLYKYAYESDIMRVILMQNGRNRMKIVRVVAENKVQDAPVKFYVVESPEVTEESFQSWCDKNQLVCGNPVVETPLKNQPPSLDIARPFRLFVAQKLMSFPD